MVKPSLPSFRKQRNKNDRKETNEMERKENKFKGIIWGIVTRNGMPVSGATVEVSGDTGPLSYINSFYLPDVGMSKTSANGMFAIVGAEDGIQEDVLHQTAGGAGEVVEAEDAVEVVGDLIKDRQQFIVGHVRLHGKRPRGARPRGLGG